MDMAIQQAIFITNAFADAYPDEHRRLWGEFEREVPHRERSGVYGKENVAYIKWLSQKKPPLFVQFIKTHIESRSVSK
jgi:hypothetical protein